MNISGDSSNEEELVLGREEIYVASPGVWSFKFSDDYVHGINLRLSNMAGGYPFTFADREWKDSERLYLCGEFSLDTAEHLHLQECLINSKSGYAAKCFVKNPNKHLVRPDFQDFRLQWMLFCVWQKCLGNQDFCDLLLQIPDGVTLVEDTSTDRQGNAEVWGCRNPELTNQRKLQKERLTATNKHLTKHALQHLIMIETNQIDSIGEWRGQNNLGKILMLCRRALITHAIPAIDYTLLQKANIYLLGQKIDVMSEGTGK